MKNKMMKLLSFGLAGVLSMSMLTACGTAVDTTESTESVEETEAHDGVDTSVITYQNINDLEVFADGVSILTFDKDVTETYADLSEYVDNANDVTYKIDVSGYSDSKTVSTLGLIYDHEIASVSYDAATSVQVKYDDFLELDNVLGEYCLTLYMMGGDIQDGYNTSQVVVMGTVEDNAAEYIKAAFAKDGTMTVTSDKDMEITVGAYITDSAHDNEGMYFKTYEIIKGESNITVKDILDEYASESDTFGTEAVDETETIETESISETEAN